MKNLDDGTTRFLTHNYGSHPKVSAAGGQVVYNEMSKDSPGVESLWFVDLESGKTVNLTPTRSVSTRHAFWLE